MQINRLFEIIYLLLNRKTVTAKELADRFEVSVRTVYRDIDTLSSAGIPIFASRGRGGGISLLDDFVLDRSVLTDQEQEEILFSLQSMNAVHQVSDIVQKLSSFFQKTDTDWIGVDFSPWGVQDNGVFNMIRDAILQKRLLSFDYFSSYGEKTARIAEPHKLFFKGRGWYVCGYCRKKEDFRLFKLMRMKGIKLLDETFVKRELPPAEPGRPSTILSFTMKVHSSCAYRLYDDFDETQIDRDADGSFIVKASMPEDNWLYGYILSYGELAEVIEPPHLRGIISQKIKKLSKQYY